MDTGMRTYGDELVAVLSAATAVLSDLPARVHRLTGADLDAVLRLVDRLAAVAAAGRSPLPSAPSTEVRSPGRRPGPPSSGSPTGARPWTPATRGWLPRRSGSWLPLI